MRPPDQPPADCWLHHALSPRPSHIAGTGLFATDDIPPGTVIARLGGRLVTTGKLAALIAAADADPDAPYVDTITVWGDLHLVMPPGTPVHFANHSCDPNAWHIDGFTIAARRGISAGEEVTVDYATQSGIDGWQMDCRCRAPKCRGLITSEDWRLPHLQARYGDHWVPALLERIRDT